MILNKTPVISATIMHIKKFPYRWQKYWKISRVVEVIMSENIEFILQVIDSTLPLRQTVRIVLIPKWARKIIRPHFLLSRPPMYGANISHWQFLLHFSHDQNTFLWSHTRSLLTLHSSTSDAILSCAEKIYKAKMDAKRRAVCRQDR